MEEKNRRERLDLEQDLAITRAAWRFERAGWIGLGVVLAAAVAGLLGPGPLSEAATGSPGSVVRVEYQRFAHFETEAVLGIEVRPPARDGEFGVWLSSDYLRQVEIRGMTPPPVSARIGPDRVVYRYEAGGDGPLAVRFEILYRKIGRLRGSAGLDGGPAVEFAHWVYP